MRHSMLFLIVSGMLIATSAAADWTLDPARSHLNFVSIKANEVAEVNTFDEIWGGVDDAGQAAITIKLDTVKTLIPIRDERMRQFLFETTNYSEAALTTRIDPKLIADLGVGEIAHIDAEANLSLHGQMQPMTLSMLVARLDAKTLMVVSSKPLIVDATKFGLSDGIEKLRDLAGLSSISRSVPVDFAITLIEAPMRE